MNHTVWKEMIYQFYDDALSPGDRVKTERHLSECADCHALLAEWKQTASTFFPPVDVPPSEAFVTRVMSRIEADEVSSAPFFERMKAQFSWPSLAMAGAGLAAWLIFISLPEKKNALVVQSTETVQYMADLVQDPGDEEDLAIESEIEDYFL